MAPTGAVRGRAQLYDRLGRRLIAAGGIGIIGAVLAIFVFISRETAPLFRPARLAPVATVALPDGPPLRVGLDPYRAVVYAVGPAGLRFARLPGGEPLAPAGALVPAGVRVTAAYRSPRDGRLALGLSDGRVLTAKVDFALTYVDGQRRVDPAVQAQDPVDLLPGEAVAAIAYRHDGDQRSAVAAVGASGRVAVRLAERRRGLLGAGRAEAAVHDLTGRVPGRVTQLLVDATVRQLVLATDGGQVQVWRLGTVAQEPVLDESFTAVTGAPVTAMAFALGDLSLLIGDGHGGVAAWFRVAGPDGGARRYQRIHEFSRHRAPVTAIAPSERDKQFLTGDEGGQMALHHATSAQTFVAQSVGAGAVVDLAFAPKADGVLAVVAGAPAIAAFDLDNPHPEVTLGTLFGRVWYEGYDRPEYVWQSTGGSDEFEAKLSLVPLIFGTVKGTLYAMLFALPMAVLAALYTAEFASPGVRSAVKPTVEIMASLPSVILGFLAGLWLAPLLEHYVLGTALLLLLAPAVVLAGAWGWRQLPRNVRLHLPRHAELVALMALTLVATAAALWLGPTLERALFAEGLPRWLAAETSLRYDQRNCLVIGFAMGFAVIPLIFTICEDALSSVPASLKAGSLGLGATRWQTAIYVVLPMALPGVFSAAMIGFGRAVGETMIVLMATGNTPIMEWNAFTGMRTISANIAVELPEAPHQGSLYRVLFLSGLLLFFVTFAVNTLAEGVRQRLREKYRRV